MVWIILGVVLGALAVVMFVLDRIYTSPKLVVCSPLIDELDSVRQLYIPIRNRKGVLHRAIKRAPVENLDAGVRVTSTTGDEFNGFCAWLHGELGTLTQPGAKVTLTEGQDNAVCLAKKGAGELECVVVDKPLPEGTYLITLTLGVTSIPEKFYYALNNRGTELARLQMKGPMTEQNARMMIQNPEKYFPLGGTG